MKEAKVINLLIIFSIILLLAGGFFLWQKDWLNEQGKIISLKEEASIWKFIPQLTGLLGQKTYLVLFQNNLELRPSGGYLGNFGIFRLKNGRLASLELHDTNIFDGFGQVQTEPPFPIKQYLQVDNWQMRDANWSPDFPTSAQQVEYFYHLQGGQEKFDGIIAVNADLMPDLLELIGPVYLEEFDKEFRAEDCLAELEYEVEKGYLERGIKEGERKTVFKALVNKIAGQLDFQMKDFILEQLNKKNILLFFKDKNIQQIADSLNWSGRVNLTYGGDYLLLSEANLGGGKSNLFIEREVDYLVDLTKDRPEARLTIKYLHQGETSNWLSHLYQAYLKIYSPAGSWLVKAEGLSGENRFVDELNKTVFANWLLVPIGQTKTVEYNYLLPAEIKQADTYQLLVQKQPGMSDFPLSLTLQTAEGQIKRETIIDHDWSTIISLEK